MPIIESFSSIPHNALNGVETPALLVDQAAVRRNIAGMIDQVGGSSFAGRLRPHVKTHKTVEISAMCVDAGITACKAATIAEAKAAAQGGVTDVLLAHPLVGAKMKAFAALQSKYPATRFATIVDDVENTGRLAMLWDQLGRTLDVFVDVDVGMGRTGVAFGDPVNALTDSIEAAPSLGFQGLHVYDGHVHQPSEQERRDSVQMILDPLQRQIAIRPTANIIVGGSPTFAIWASLVPADTDGTAWQFSSGTSSFWDVGYASNYGELNYEIAACLLTRVISRPGRERLCLDLGTKAIATEMGLADRVLFPSIADAVLIAQSEEHLVIETSLSGQFQVGDPVIALPRHICPSVACHREAIVFDDGVRTDHPWSIIGRR